MAAGLEEQEKDNYNQTIAIHNRTWQSTISSRNFFFMKLKESTSLQSNRNRTTFLSRVVDEVQMNFLKRRILRKDDNNGNNEATSTLAHGELVSREDDHSVGQNIENRTMTVKEKQMNKSTDTDGNFAACTNEFTQHLNTRFPRKRSVSAMSFRPHFLPSLASYSDDSDGDLSSDSVQTNTTKQDDRITPRFPSTGKSRWKGLKDHYLRGTVSQPTSPRVGGVGSRTHNLRRLQYGKSYQVLPPSPFNKTQSGWLEENRKQRILRKVRSYNDFNQKKTCRLYLPLVKFRRAVRTVMLLLKATVSSRQNNQRSERRMLSWTQVHDELGTSRRAYERFGLTFDPGAFKANRETQISAEVKMILSMEPGERKTDKLHLALMGLNSAVEVFGEFPIKMQQSLVRVGWYERFEAKRVIIRQGHTADNFYFILSGTAVVTVLDTDPVTKEQYANTVALLKKGNSFGELALMHGARRSATVTCKDDVELLAVGRDDFVDIFMHVEKNREPDHLCFLHTIDLLQGWPVHTLPYHNPNICLFTYFRRGVLLCKDSNAADWIYVIKTGTCRVLKSLNVARAKVKIKKKTTKKKLPCKNLRHIPGILSRKENSTLSNSWTPDNILKPKLKHQVTFSLPTVQDTPKDELQQSAEKHIKELDDILQKQNISEVGKSSPQSELDETEDGTEQIFVEVQKMGPKDIYGLEQAVFSLIKSTTSTSLVSDGAECVLINRKFFLRHLSEDTAKRIRKTIQPFPTEEALQHKLENKANWEAFKTSTLLDQLVYRKHVHDYLNF